VPAAVEAAIKSDLHPIRPLSSPARRALRLAPLVALTLIAASSVFALRGDAPTLGWVLTWGASMSQAAFALAVIALALQDAVPGRTVTGSAALLAAGSVLGFSLVATLRTWELSPSMIVPEMVGWVGRVCFVGTVVSAVPLLAAAAVLTSRALVVRPWSSGALYGLGAGLGADAGWRLFCHYSDPMHVFSTHTGGVLAATLIGVGVAVAVQRSRVSAVARSRS
jgi:hypothetical protein